jgi:uncharacterized protein
VKLLQAPAHEGFADAQTKLGAMYDDGLGVAQDHQRARELFKQAADQGYTPAMVDLGRMYVEAIGGKRDDIQGYALIRAGIDLGVPAELHAIAFYELGEAGARLSRQQLAHARDMAHQLTGSRSLGNRPISDGPHQRVWL